MLALQPDSVCSKIVCKTQRFFAKLNSDYVLKRACAIRLSNAQQASFMSLDAGIMNAYLLCYISGGLGGWFCVS